MKLSIVTTIYKSAPYIIEFYNRIISTASKITDHFEIIFVNDGSPDNSIEIIKKIANEDPKVKLIDLSRNFGHHKAIMTGLSFAAGQYIFLIDSDLEEDPELLIHFFSELTTKNVDVVYGVQEKERKGNAIEKSTGWLFYKMINWLSDIKITENLALVRLMTKKYVINLLKYTERELVFVGIAALTGFKQISFPIIKKHKDKSTYTLNLKINLAVNFITSLSSKPLIYIFNFGVLLMLTSFFLAIYLLFKKMVFGISIIGWSSIMVSILFFSGVITFCLGIIGIYLAKIFIEVKQRPHTIIKEIYTMQPEDRP